VLAKYAKETDPLESGMILHSELLHDKDAALEVAYGRGRILLYGFKPQHRGQSHGTYRYLFNALYQYDNPPMPSEASSAAPVATTAAASTAAAPASQAAPTAGRRRSGGSQP
jgi:hypothetical protein